MERLDGYIRVSQVAGRGGDRFHSPTQQREAIQAWATTHGITIAAWHEDLDRSGGTMDRPGMNLALQRVDQGLTGGVVVAKLDRFARTVVGGLTTIQALDQRGARVVSVAESIDPATPVGRAMLGLLLIMAEWQRDQADEALANAQHRATSAGRFPGRTPYGYMRTPNGLTVQHPDTSQIVTRIYRERAAGTGWRLIADQLTSSHIPSPNGNGWAPSTVQGIIRSEASLGTFIGPRGLRVEDAWTPIIDRELWAAANNVRGRRDNDRRHNDRLYAGTVRCANCRYVMTRAVNPHGFVSYSCAGGRRCTQRATISAALLDEHVTSLIDERLDQLQFSSSVNIDTSDHDRLTARAGATLREFEAWRDDTESRQIIGETDYREGLHARARARDQAAVELDQHRTTTGIADVVPAGVRVTLAVLPWELRRRVAERLLHAVWVRRSDRRGSAATRHVADRLLVTWADDPGCQHLPGPSGRDLGPVRW